MIGVLRLFLAIIVVIFHTGQINGWSPISGPTAVELFFMISGFYMALILTTKYNREHDYWPFISNRILKIFPTYLVVLFLTIVVSIVLFAVYGDGSTLKMWLSGIGGLHPAVILYLVLSNMMIFGQDLMMLLQFTGNGLVGFSINPLLPTPRLYNFLFVPQAWSMALELCFYLMAPILNKWRTKNLLILAAGSIILRDSMLAIGFPIDPWGYRFYPTTMFLFIAGMISYRLYGNFIIKWQKSKLLFMIPIGFILLLCVYDKSKFTSDLSMYLLCTLTVFVLPILFHISRDIKIDRVIGEMSYPMYVSHILIFTILSTVPLFAWMKGTLFAVYVILGTLIVSIILYRIVLRPIDRIRQNRIKGKKISVHTVVSQ